MSQSAAFPTRVRREALAHKRPDLLEQMQKGKLTPNRSAIEAGSIRVSTRLEVAQKAAVELTPVEQAPFAGWFQRLRLLKGA